MLCSARWLRPTTSIIQYSDKNFWNRPRLLCTYSAATTDNTVTSSSRQEQRNARKSRAHTNSSDHHSPPESSGKGKGNALPIVGAALVCGVAGYAVYDINEDKKGFFHTLYYHPEVQKVLKLVYSSTVGRWQEIYKPESDQLIPEWGSLPFYEGVPRGAPCPPLLVIDVEKTLIASVHDSAHGWRHVKRPGVDRFLQSLRQYYELVLFSENDIGVVQEIFEALDKENAAHKLGSSAAEARGTLMLKRLDLMSRDLSRIILIDDSREASQLFPRNTIIVPPFEDIHNKSDHVLEDLIPVLQAFVHEGVTDFRDTLDDMGTCEAEEVVAEYRFRLSKYKKEQYRRRNIGLGGLIRGPQKDEEDDLDVHRSVLSASEIVGLTPMELANIKAYEAMSPSSSVRENYFNKDKPKPSGVKKKGMLVDLLEKRMEMKEEEERLRMQKLNELHQQRELAKLQQQQQQQNHK